jgi:hypothetical protein
VSPLWTKSKTVIVKNGWAWHPKWRQKGTQLAKVLNKNPDVVSWWVGEGIRRRQEDEEFAARFDMLDTELSALLTRGDQ